MKIVRQVILWMLLLFGGWFIVSAVETVPARAGSGAGMGYYSYWFRLTLEPFPLSTRPDEIIGQLGIEGKAPSRWMKDGGVAPRYQSVEIDWSMFSLDGGYGESSGRCSIDLATNEIVSDSGRRPLSRENLQGLLGMEKASEQAIGFLDEVMAKLEACRSGTLPRPRHHTYYSEAAPARMRLQHFASGISLPYPELNWTGLWFLCLLGVGTAKWMNQANSRAMAT